MVEDCRRRRRLRWTLLSVVAVALLGTTAVIVVKACQPEQRFQSAVHGPVRPTAAPPAGNPLNGDLRLSGLPCSLPELTLDSVGQDSFVRTAVACLDAVWAPVLRGAGVPFTPLGVAMRTRSTAACGLAGDTVFYCQDTLYWIADDLPRRGMGAEHSAFYLYVVFRQYGHHLQRLAQISEIGDEPITEGEQHTPQQWELRRRLELQAQCLAGISFAAAARTGVVGPAEQRELIDPASTVDRESVPAFGSTASNRKWLNTGLRAANTAACDTWRAPGGEVS